MRSIKHRLHAGERVIVAGVGRIPHYVPIQILGQRGGFHGVWFDIEHCGWSVEQIEVGAMAARSEGLDSFCRIPPTDYSLVARCLEAGAGGVLAAQINSVEQAEEFVHWSLFAPHGRRGLNTGCYQAEFGAVPAASFCTAANRDVLVGIQIETIGALEHCDEIAALPGVDLLFFGPADMSQALGVTGDIFHAKCIDAMRMISIACRQAGKPWGGVCLSPEHAAVMAEHGSLLFSPTNDVRAFSAGIAATKASFSNLFS